MSYPVTQQPMSGYGHQSPTSQQSLPGLEVLMQSEKLKVKQRRPECLECKFLFQNAYNSPQELCFNQYLDVGSTRTSMMCLMNTVPKSSLWKKNPDALTGFAALTFVLWKSVFKICKEMNCYDSKDHYDVWIVAVTFAIPIGPK